MANHANQSAVGHNDQSDKDLPNENPGSQADKDPKKWKLTVQGVHVEFNKPIITAREALVAAGFDPEKAWHIYLIVKGNQKEELSIDSEIDLSRPGLEKIRLMPKNVDNGDDQVIANRRKFMLLDTDHAYLDSLGCRWETILVGEARWLLIYDYVLPEGYTPRVSTLGLSIPVDYPASQIDMFYFHPFIYKAGGVEVPSTQVRAALEGLQYQGWSRHRNAGLNPWNPESDNIRTHMALVEGCLLKELGQ